MSETHEVLDIHGDPVQLHYCPSCQPVTCLICARRIKKRHWWVVLPGGYLVHDKCADMAPPDG
jgi:hypothetical protein